MRNCFSSIFLTAACCFALAGSVQAKVVKTPYYSLDLGDNWEQPQDDQLHNNDYATFYTNKSHDTAIYLSIHEVKMTAEEIANKTAESMKASGVKVQPLQKKGDTISFEYDIKDVPGKYFFVTTPHGYVAISIIGANISEAEALIKNIKPFGKITMPDVQQ